MKYMWEYFFLLKYIFEEFEMKLKLRRNNEKRYKIHLTFYVKNLFCNNEYKEWQIQYQGSRS